jgi:hypothetical protein
MNSSDVACVLQKLAQYMHVSDEENVPGKKYENYDILYKVRPVLYALNTFRKVYNPHSNMAVDRIMMKFKRYFSFKQCMPTKPTKWGKAWRI